MSQQNLRIAIAGGTGGIGRHVVEALLHTGKDIVVLSRSPSPVLSSIGVKVIVVDYDNENSLVTALSDVHTVISTIAAFDYHFVTSQINLVHAAVKAGVRRFAPSEFAMPSRQIKSLEPYKFKVTVLDAVIKSGLEYTVISNGLFMNYLAFGSPKGAEGLGYLRQMPYIVDLSTLQAELPGSGDDKLAFTRAEDVGTFVAKLVDLPKWPQESTVAGTIGSYNYIVEVAEKIIGKKIDVTYVLEDALVARLEYDHTNVNYNAQMKLAIIRSEYEVKGDLLEIPGFRPMAVEEFLKMWWEQKQEV